MLVTCCLFLVACGSKENKKAFRIGVDPNWTSINTYGQEKLINGFVEELLAEIAQENKEVFLRVSANWDSLFDDLHKGRTDAVISSLPAYNFNSARFAFSENILDLGPVLVVPVSSSKKIKDLSGKRVGVVEDDKNIFYLSQIPNMIMHAYPAVPVLLESVANGELDAALMDRILAVSFVGNLFDKKLKVIEPPLSDFGLHFVTLKKGEKRIEEFNKSIKKMSRKKRLQELQKKWNL